MFGSVVLGVAVGMSLIYWFLSLLSSFVHEALATLLSARSKTLRSAIERLVDGQVGEAAIVTKALYKHSLIQGLGLPKFGATTEGPSSPSYIPSKIFALALLESVGASGSKIEDVRAAIERSPKAKELLGPMIAVAGNDIVKLRDEIAHWFDMSMERASAWYKRRAGLSILIIAIAITIGGNLDTLKIGEELWHDATVREMVVAAAATARDNAPTSVAQAVHQLGGLNIPAGWSTIAPLDSWTVGGCLSRMIGWLLTILAITVGAPFWFDVLSKFSQFGGNGAAPAHAVPSTPAPTASAAAVALPVAAAVAPPAASAAPPEPPAAAPLT